MLVERTVGEVLPAVKTNRDNLAAVRGHAFGPGAQCRSGMALANCDGTGFLTSAQPSRSRLLHSQSPHPSAALSPAGGQL